MEHIDGMLQVTNKKKNGKKEKPMKEAVRIFFSFLDVKSSCFSVVVVVV